MPTTPMRITGIGMIDKASTRSVVVGGGRIPAQAQLRRHASAASVTASTGAVSTMPMRK